MSKAKCFLYVGGAAFILGFLASFLFFERETFFKCQNNFTYTSPELDCLSLDVDAERLKRVEFSIRAHIEEVKKKDTSISRVSVFYRNLKTKKWFGINEQDLFTPGSLLKIPLAIAYHKYREINPSVFNQYLVFKGLPGGVSDNVGQHVQPLELMVPGKSYLVKDLLSRLLVYSDNDAIIPLFEAVDPNFYEKVLKDFDIKLPAEIGVERDFVTVKTYGALFRALYNASYLNRTESEEILSDMGETIFKDGLVAGVPADVRVSHKFGERSYTSATSTALSSSLEFHDCGIIYQIDSPYILCVMTEGTDFKKQTEIIKSISHLVYSQQ